MTLEGEVEIEGKKYGPGSYLFNPPANEHGPFKTGANGWMAYCTFDGPSGMEEAIGFQPLRSKRCAVFQLCHGWSFQLQ